MSYPEKQPNVEDRPESPTTAGALNFDDDTPETPASTPKIEQPSTATPAKPAEDVAPPKPPRPLAPEQQAEATLREAFPSIDGSVIRAVLRASDGRLEPAFNALLGMSDPDASEPPAPAQPPRPNQSRFPETSTQESQLAADERYARQLAEHYNGAAVYGAPPRSGSGHERDVRGRRPPREIGFAPIQTEGRERSFIDDDLPIIRDNIKKGFLETQSTVNKWVNSLKKKIDGDDEDAFNDRPQAAAQGYIPQQQYSGRRSSEFARRSADRERYDADPHVLGDDFASLQLRDSEAQQPRRSSRPLANPDLFKPIPPRPHSSQSGTGRRVSFQSGPPEEINVHYPKSPIPTSRPSSGVGKPSKWQPLAAVDPDPVADHDPFSLGDSDDEEKKKDVNADDTERLKQAAEEAKSEDYASPSEKKLEPQERSGD